VTSLTHKRFLFAPGVHASVALVGMNARDVTYPLLLTILEVHGLSAHEQNEVIVIAPDTYDRHIASALVSPGNIRTSDAEIVTALVTVKNVSAPQLVPVLRPLMPQQAQMSAVTGRNALIIVDRTANVRRLIALIEAIDKLPQSSSPSPNPTDAKGE
jgi:general secretion pathway protein D